MFTRYDTSWTRISRIQDVYRPLHAGPSLVSRMKPSVMNRVIDMVSNKKPRHSRDKTFGQPPHVRPQRRLHFS